MDKELNTYSYCQGLGAAWELAKKICLPQWRGGMNGTELKQCFDTASWCEVLAKFSPSQALDMLEKFECSRTVKVGDVLKISDVYSNKDSYAVVLNTAHNDKIYVMWDDGSAGEVEKTGFEKTGIHLEDIARLLKLLKNGGKDDDAERRTT